ncbi:MAG TPA: ISAs1 family transposase, partial [Geminicoccaceae bacterium]|nr:ISAs1 family transposase [Geminicoccaceae bacterium]
SAHAVRRHRHGEDRPHRVPDVVFRDDPGRLRSTGHGPRTMAIVGHMAMNLVRTAPGQHSLEVRRKRAAWNGDYLAAIPRQTP